MKFDTVALKEHYGFIKGGSLRILAMDNPWGRGHHWMRPLVLVVPGGAYWGVAKREGEPVAAEFFAKGYQVAILDYLCKEQGAMYPEALFEVGAAVDYLRRNAKSYDVNPKEIFLCGFSAGGHLVADYSNEFPSLAKRTGASLDCEIKAVGLSYPVIDEHDESFENLLFGYDSAEKARLKEKLKATNLVSENTPPTFLWTTAEDALVPPQNAMRYALALANNKVSYELHVYPWGGHGMSTGSLELNENERAAKTLSSWTTEIARFFRSFCKEPF